uniref:Uncharacterized protein n=1 Tax=Steinernema glaseri TaxID=37863 RepID=A0A1I7YPL8_9BILA
MGDLSYSAVLVFMFILVLLNVAGCLFYFFFKRVCRNQRGQEHIISDRLEVFDDIVVPTPTEPCNKDPTLSSSVANEEVPCGLTLPIRRTESEVSPASSTYVNLSSASSLVLVDVVPSVLRAPSPRGTTKAIDTAADVESTQQSSQRLQTSATQDATKRTLGTLQPTNAGATDTPLSICAYSLPSDASTTSASTFSAY